MLDTTRVKSKTVWCMKEKNDVHKLSAYDFGWSLAKSLAMTHAVRRNINCLGIMVQLKRKLFLATALTEPEPQP